MILRPRRLAASSYEQGCDNLEEPGRLLVDLRRLVWVDPHGTVALAVNIDWAQRNGYDIVVRSQDNLDDPVRYLSRMMSDWLDERRIDHDLPTVGHHAARNRFEALHEFEAIGGDFGGSSRVARLVRDHLNDSSSTGVSETVWVALEEICGNVVYHAAAPQGFAAAQVVRRGRRGQRVKFAIGDAGIGVAAALANADHVVNDDEHALRLAMELHVTSIMDDPHRGLGIPDSIDAIRDVEGLFALRSGTAMAQGGPGGTAFEACNWQPGVLFSAELPCPPQTTKGW